MGGGGILPKGYIKVQGILFSNSIDLSVNVTDSRKPTEMISEFCVITQPSTWDSILGYWNDSNKCYNRLGVSHSAYVPVADSNKIYYRKQSGANILSYMQELILHKWYNFHAFADGNMTLNKELYNYEDVGTTLYSYSLLHLNFNARTNVYGHQAFVYDGNPQFDLYPCITPSGVVAFFDKAKNEVLSVSSPIAYLTSLQALNLSKLPIVASGTLTVSLPWDAQWNIGVQNALSIVATRGWTITVQYRDPEVATANIPIGFLESTGEQYINTNVVPDSTIEFDMQIAYTTPLKETIGYKPYFGCIGRDSYGNFRLAHSSNVTESNDFEAFVMESFYWFRYNADDIKVRKIYRLQTALTPLSGTTPAVSIDGTPMTFISRSAGSYSYTGSITTPIGLFGRIGFGEIASNGTPFIIQSANLIKNGKSAFNAISVLDPSGIPCMYDRVTKQPFYNAGTGAFIAGFDTVEQARNLAHLTDVTAETDETKKSLTVSLPWEAQLVITGVPAALQVAADRGWTITVQYRDPEVDNIYYNKYATCTKQADMIAVNVNYKADLTADGKWIYPLPQLVNSAGVFQDVQISEFVLSELPELTSTYFFMAGNYALTRFYTRAPKITHTERWFRKTSLEVFDYNGEVFNPLTMLMTFSASYNFRTFNAVFGRKMGNCENAFDGCILDKSSVLRIANSALPTASGNPFTIGIHIDLQSDTEVLDALALMETNGWALTTQWNGTATASTASTFGLRSPSIYAKLNTIELSDGTTETLLDWGHYVTNWEERGYQEFASLEAANEYFNINQTE